MRRPGSPFKNESARQNKPARFQLTSCYSETVSTELTTDHPVGFKTMQNNDATNEPAHLHVIISLFIVSSMCADGIVAGLIDFCKIYS